MIRSGPASAPLSLEMRFFSRSDEPFEFELSMAGVKLGTRVLQVGSTTALIAALATKVGLSGHATALVETQTAADIIEKAAAKAGALVEIRIAPIGALPFEPASFDLAVVPDLIDILLPEDRVDCLREVRRVLRTGGRCLVIEPAPRGGLAALFSRRQRDSAYAQYGGAETALTEERFKPVRVLALRNGRLFTEGMRPGDG